MRYLKEYIDFEDFDWEEDEPIDSGSDEPIGSKTWMNFKVGDVVNHPTFGDGVITEITKRKDDYGCKFKISFHNSTKHILPAISKFTKVGTYGVNESIDFNEDDWEFEEENFNIGDRVVVNWKTSYINIKNREGEIVDIYDDIGEKRYLIRFNTRFNSNQFKYIGNKSNGVGGMHGSTGANIEMFKDPKYGEYYLKDYKRKIKGLKDMDPEHEIGRLLWIDEKHITHI